jgi:hypothetical protein
VGATGGARPVVVDEQIPIGNTGRADAIVALRRRLEACAGVEVRDVAADELLVVHTYRPRWALISGIVLALPTLGLALLLLLIRRRDTAQLRLSMTPDGLSLAMRGCVEESLLHELRSLRAGTGTSGWSAAAGAPRVPAPLSSTPLASTLLASAPLASATQTSALLGSSLLGDGSGPLTEAVASELTVRRPASSTVPGGPHPPAPTGFVLRFDSGQRVAATALVLVGRDPLGGPGEEAATLVPIDDPDRSVSKTHLAVEAAPGGVWVTDRHSTNGAEVIEDGVARHLPPGTGVLVPRSATVRFGERRFDVL